MIYATKKTRSEVNLPDVKTVCYQPNEITTACYNYSLIQERIFNYIVFYLQAYIKQVMSGAAVMQLDLFQRPEHYWIDIPLSLLGSPSQYQVIRESAKEMCSIILTIKGRSKTNKKVTRFMGLFSEVQMPDENRRSSFLSIEIKKDIAYYLINIDRNTTNQPINYTSFILEIANRSKNKYTSRIYKLISSWKNRGGFVISIEDLKEMLQLGSEYNNYADIKRRILIPVQKELQNNADCWYNCSEDNFEEKEGKKVINLRFKIITPDIEVVRERLHNNILYLLTTHFKLTSDHTRQLIPIFDNKPDYQAIQQKVLELAEVIRERKDINSIPNYVTKVLLTEFGSIKNS